MTSVIVPNLMYLQLKLIAKLMLILFYCFAKMALCRLDLVKCCILPTVYTFPKFPNCFNAIETMTVRQVQCIIISERE